MKPLKVAILWHQHQPYYKQDNQFLLPWVRMHGIKDYYDLPALLNEFPNVKQTFNVVPSLLLQLEEYTSNTTADYVQTLSRIPAKLLNSQQKQDILRLFFILNYDNLIKPYDRYNELHSIANSPNFNIDDFTTQDWLDLQVWYNLAWLGQVSRLTPFPQRLFRKHRNFNENEKLELLQFHNEILTSIFPEMKRLQNLGQVELSVSPTYHPILPLLCDSAVAHEQTPNINLPNPIYKYPEDAVHQIQTGIQTYRRYFDTMPKGMWPSEGSVSNEVLDIMAKQGLLWAATDENILRNALKDEYKDTYKYFPYDIQTKDSSITCFFRDHYLSDKIGFLYSNWNPYDAACNFREELFAIRNNIINLHGEDALSSAVVTIILDAENCWEFFHDNGIHFLRNFFSMLGSNPEIETITFSEALNLPIPAFLPNVNSVKAGSWINGNFDIWIGDKEDIDGWNLLSEVRQIVEQRKNNFDGNTLNEQTLAEIMNEIYIAEGSDWFWWFGPQFNAPNRKDFDILFRHHIANIYKLLNMQPPTILNEPIMKTETTSEFSTMAKSL